jgi:glycosyltransferase involved in cell wall biosynthesis
MKLKLVSIILPVYNVEKYIAKSIQSVLNQTYTNFELLVIIDGSPDNSKEIASSFSDERITIYEKENGGLSDARNYGLERAKGDYVYFMDSDDWIEPNLLETSLAGIVKSNSDFVVFGYFQDNEDTMGNLINFDEVLHNEITFKKGTILFEENTLGLMGYAWNKLYKTSFLNEYNLKFNKGVSLVEDILFNLECFKNSENISFIDSVLYHYINRPVETLIKTFHKDSFELKLLKHNALKSFFDVWSFQEKNNIISISIVAGIRYCVHNLFTFKNDLSFKEKCFFVRKMLNNKETIKYINYYKPKSLADKIYKKLIKYKAVILICVLFKIIK